MASSLHRSTISWSGVFIALLGAVFCGFQAGLLGESLPCPSAGCYLFRDMTVGGYSLWWAGLAAFSVLALCCLRRLRGMALFLATLGLSFDIALLLFMLGTAPCVSCLGAALLLGLFFLALRRSPDPRQRTRGTSYLFLVWAMLFLANGAAALNESVGEWVLYGAEQTDRRIYFSPSCPACRDALISFAGKAAFVPVAERDGDAQAIARMRQALADGLSLEQALAGSFSGPEPKDSLLQTALMHLRLTRNKARVLSLGFTKVPLIMLNGLPQSLNTAPKPQRAPQPAPAPADARSTLPPELDRMDQCGDTPAPCDPPR